MTNTAVSKDGTTIAYDRAGDGPAVVLVDGALCSRAQGPMPDLSKELAGRFTVYNYDRRGRGDSGGSKTGDAAYELDREIEDLAAVIEAAGGSAYVYGTSSGAALALRAAAAGVPITKLAVFEAPFVVDDSRKPIPRTWVADLQQLVDAGRRGDAVKYFMTKGIGLPGVVVLMMKLMPAWKPMKELAHTLPYDAALLGENCFGQPLDASQWSSLEQPVLVAGGGKSPGWMRTSVWAVADAIPGATHREIPGQNHIIKATAIAPVLTEFFS
ncbi:pimeloyl-ACP methyl ester carboxylesterase [Kribbella sp. VKM Ac-2527]|uniref:Pimeloyl-ACP methyl ester carboxylesterase n=1 Tax=Kribbella caucasensis TaxID=2512215 RepID=A0A4R6K7P1_9ACTN|nr:alpha/beta hydrolase [Kribbella sp. VKM Ac-2527]TDO45683.1 pimeloyl-ACP methyl ester carboxylesterase [Kribbella sp. VKM Ac-2527]